MTAETAVNEAPDPDSDRDPDAPEHVDVIVVGAGISGIGAAYHLQNKSPDRSLMVLEGRGDIGGTWDLFTYPGIRSDSDMHTLGYSFKPWIHEKAIADGPSIMEYLRETVAEHDLRKYMRFHHHVTSAAWSTDEARWTVTATRTDPDTGAVKTVAYTCSFLFMCSGYYSYKGGYTPEFPGLDDFGGQVVHPQEWPDDLDYAGKRVVVIGSGATAMTLVPAMADEVEHITMLQRSPTYIVARPAVDPIAQALRKVPLERVEPQPGLPSLRPALTALLVADRALMEVVRLRLNRSPFLYLAACLQLDTPLLPLNCDTP